MFHPFQIISLSCRDIRYLAPFRPEPEPEPDRKKTAGYPANRNRNRISGTSLVVGVYWSKRWWRWWWQLDYWSYKSCKAPVKPSPPINQHPVFYRPHALPVAKPTVSKHWREKYHIPWTCLYQAHLGVFQLCLWPLTAPGYLGIAHAIFLQAVT